MKICTSCNREFEKYVVKLDGLLCPHCRTVLSSTDLLHISYEKLTIQYKFGIHITLNKALLDQQNCWQNLESIKNAHWLKFMLYDLMRETDDHSELFSLGLDLEEVEYELQRLWKFRLDKQFHRFWEYPKCQCPKLDNVDSYPYMAYINGACPVHVDV